MRRLGGSYGAKLTRNSIVSCAAILAAYKLKKPIKMLMPLQANVKVIGKRFPSSCDYEVGVNDNGVIQYLRNVFYLDYGINGGNDSPMTHVLDLLTANYVSDTYYLSANATRSDTPAGTWCRAPGTTEGMAMMETIMDHIAYTIDKNPLEVRIANIDPNKRQKLLYFINDHRKWADIEKRKEAIGDFNAVSKKVK